MKLREWKNNLNKGQKIMIVTWSLLLLVIILCIFLHIYGVNKFNQIEWTYISGQEDEGVSFNFAPRGGITDSWLKRDIDLNGTVCDVTGITYDGVISNNTDVDINEWSLKVNIEGPCYINNEWNGEVEIHQMTSSGEKVQRLNLQDYKEEDIKLDHIYIDQDLLITLDKGDYIIYHPSTESKENIVNAANGMPGQVTIGMIFYYVDEVSFDNYSIDYRFHKTIRQGRTHVILQVIVLIWLFVAVVCIIADMVSVRIRKKTEYELTKTHLEETEGLNRQIAEALEEAERANRVKSDFLANMSHEIRTPINAIIGMNTMVIRESDQDSVRKYAYDIKTASSTLLSLINDILDFSKIESGKMEIIDSEYRLDSVINDLINMVRPRAEEKDLSLSVEADPLTPVMLIGDEVRIKQIILNVLNNAVKYTRKGSVLLSVGYEMADEDTVSLKISVKDTGIGIKKEDMEKLFSPYERLEEGKNRKVEGTGLGLSITKSLLVMMGSRLEVESVYGQGSDFFFTLQQKVCGNEVIGEHFNENDISSFSEEAPEKYNAPDAKLLVVDDLEVNLMVIKNLLKRVCIDPECCMSGSEAVKLCSDTKYDIIFMDAMMPGMNGDEALRTIRQTSTVNRDTPIIMLTANAISGAREEYLNIGFTDYLSKPVDGIKLEDMIQKYLPDELIKPAKGKIYETEKADADTERKLAFISMIRDIDAANGITAAGGKTTYIGICETFAETARDRISVIRDYFTKMDIPNYTIQVHALKSAARLIGANELSKDALELELAGQSGDIHSISKKTESLLDKYDKISSIMEKILSSSAKNAEEDTRPEISDRKLQQRLEEMSELLEAFEFETALELYRELAGYRIPDKCSEAFDKMGPLFAEVDRDGLINIISQILNNY